MPLYMIQFSYTAEAWATLTKNPQDRRTGLDAAAQKLGGRLASLHYCFGEYDGVVMAEAPDDTTACAIVLGAVSAGHLKSVKTTKLFTVEETMDAMRRAGSLAYQAPSGS
ncbi:MAG TPA: GYD domain-containing protein [Roseiflexaceae bacterium]|jgi:uncharacterized protein with GYD domain